VPSWRNLLDSLVATPAYVVDATYEVLAWNRMATFFIGDAYCAEPGSPTHAAFRQLAEQETHA
jgi:hypothetical protein